MAGHLTPPRAQRPSTIEKIMSSETMTMQEKRRLAALKVRLKVAQRLLCNHQKNKTRLAAARLGCSRRSRRRELRKLYLWSKAPDDWELRSNPAFYATVFDATTSVLRMDQAATAARGGGKQRAARDEEIVEAGPFPNAKGAVEGVFKRWWAVPDKQTAPSKVTFAESDDVCFNKYDEAHARVFNKLSRASADLNGDDRVDDGHHDTPSDDDSFSDGHHDDPSDDDGFSDATMLLDDLDDGGGAGGEHDVSTGDNAFNDATTLLDDSDKDWNGNEGHNDVPACDDDFSDATTFLDAFDAGDDGADGERHDAPAGSGDLSDATTFLDDLCAGAESPCAC